MGLFVGEPRTLSWAGMNDALGVSPHADLNGLLKSRDEGIRFFGLVFPAIDELAGADEDALASGCLERSKNEVWRSFGEHLDKCLWKPSGRSRGGRKARVRAGLAGRFVYEPPDGVKWSG
jgi:hypothetical protein